MNADNHTHSFPKNEHYTTVSGTWLSARIGRNLVNLICEQERNEANFRDALARFREHVESVALYRGEVRECESLKTLLSTLMSNSHVIMLHSLRLNFFSNSFTQLSDIIPYLVASTRYFSKKITLGDLTQIRSSFGYVQMSLLFFLTSYPRIAQWRAATKRLIDLDKTLKDLHATQKNSRIKIIHTSKEQNIQIKGLTVQFPLKTAVDHPEILIENFNWVFKLHQSVLITGTKTITITVSDLIELVF